MKKFFLLSFILLMSVLLFAQQSKEKDNVINLIRQYDKALAKKDSVTLKNILTDDFIGSVPNGQSFDKSHFISYHCNPATRVREVKDEGTSGWSIRVLKECALINRNITYIMRTGGSDKPVEIKVKKLEVCVNVSGKWKIASLQGTEILK